MDLFVYIYTSIYTYIHTLHTERRRLRGERERDFDRTTRKHQHRIATAAELRRTRQSDRTDVVMQTPN